MPPVETHEVHEKVRINADKPYGCHNREKHGNGYQAPDRRYKPDGTFYVIQTYVMHKMSTDCRYDMSLTDARCTNCKHQGSGEAYNQMVRSKGT